MNHARLIKLTSVRQLRDVAPHWDDLWQRSDATTPTVRAEMVAQWLEQFSSPGDFRALVVEIQGQWVAALPLVQNPNSGVLRTGRLTSNIWSVNGDLLLDPSTEVDAILDLLVTGMRRVPWRLLWLNGIPLDAPRWKALQQAVDRAGLASDCHGQTQVGLIQTSANWEAFRRSLSKKHRAKMARCNRRLAEKGDVRLVVLSRPNTEQLEHWMRTAFEIEDRSWKGKAGTSVLRSPRMFEFFIRQARQLAEWGQLELALICAGEKLVAFNYGYTAKGVSHWHKIGYDPEYASCSPGQLLQYHLLEQLHTEGERLGVDTMGPLTDALAKWNPVPSRRGRLTIATRGLIWPPLLIAGKRSMPLLRWLRDLKGNGRRGEKRRRKHRKLGMNQMVGNTRHATSSKFRRGQIVEVRSQSEVLATLDADGKLEGLPFQPEMLRFCGQRFRVLRRAERVFLDHHYYVAKLDNTVLLEGPRCDGQAHGGCQMGCLTFWKEAWLKPVGQNQERTARAVLQERSTGSTAPVSRLRVREGDRYCCQASELANASRRVPWWDVRQYAHDLFSGEMTFGQVARMFRLLFRNKFRRMLGRPSHGRTREQQTRTPTVSLNFRPGELVEVKTKEEIEATLDATGKNRGLGFGGSMVEFCEKRYRVASRVDKIVLEWSGQLRELSDTVALENVICDGLDKRGCPRSCYHLWREIWLRRVPQSSPSPADNVPGDVAQSPGLLVSPSGQQMEGTSLVGDSG